MLDILVDFVLEPVARAIFYPIGWPIVKLISWGRYPSKGMWFKDTPESNWTMGLGIAAVVIAIMVALHQF
ncbi:hypothetical protein LOY47_20240 [Pseudomonas brassicacearum]|jgi:hypothetical protein|uniref:hypothetical protein n=1 Tax=Pseudomonas TaxID=286 RepID=UPI00025FFC1C|nr:MULTISPECIES: hypothetical protein [Pseudomonas]EIK66858.1 hypothetical protein PflQ8_3874 [Pseudomonas fluorescens Q8r1-96]KAB0523607.1 hypothetical protein F7R20_20710 [Pseudomonas brassicacearum subsp. brassicacearum]KQW17987.1 hypothetical protein ASC85_29520 [Pseudomonas sp. Root401]NJP61568.1 hypothetical protein [Pseudomonas brassicacearum]PJH87465.1 hypothetical protein CVG87_19635 [Pseudomonas sp. WCS365]